MKNVLKICLFGLIAVASVCFGQTDNEQALNADPAYQQLAKMVGGVWHARVDGMNIESRYSIGPDGLSIVGDTVIQLKDKPFHMAPRFGWDAAAKQVYYLDAHGSDTVYFGHAMMDGSDMLLTFKGLVGDPGSFVIRILLKGDDSFHSILTDASSGKTIEEFDWTRTRA